jgi:hypothetical protein
MKNKNVVCPLSYFADPFITSKCIQDQCEWWSKEDNLCIIKAIKTMLKEIKARQ